MDPFGADTANAARRAAKKDMEVERTKEPGPVQTTFPSDDKALTAFAQLGALRLNARRCLISFFDRRNCYILAEATRTLSLETGQAQIAGDRLCWGTTAFPKHESVCYSTVNLPMLGCAGRPNDYSNVPTLIVNDLSLDDRFRNFSFVSGPPYSRFYAGVPIRSPSGHSIGTYCVLDEVPRNGLSETEISFLKDMANTVMRHLEMMRATDDHRRGGVMVRSLGSFAEGKSSLEDWWQDPWEAAESTSPVPEQLPLSRKRRSNTVNSAVPPHLDFQETIAIPRKDSGESLSPSVKSPIATSPESGPGSITPASELMFDSRPSKTASATKNEPQQNSISPEVRTTFTRAANMIRGATESDGTIFFDAKVSTFGGLVDDEFLPDAEPGQDKACAILGAATTAGAASASPDGTNVMYESFLRHLLRTYPHGQIFNFDDDEEPTFQFTDPFGNDAPKPLTETLAFISSTTKRPESAKSQDDENLLKEVFPNARTLVLYPLWDSHRDRWCAGAIMWSCDPIRVFTSEQELSYLAAFSNSIMAEVARLDVKLADAAKGDFISSISHELRSPLHGILGSCELLRDSEIDNFQSGMTQTIETCGKTLLDTINHVLDFAKINNLTRGTSKRLKKRSQSTKHTISPAQSHTNDILTLITDVDLSVLTEEVLETVFAGHNFQKSTTQTFYGQGQGQGAPGSDSQPISIIVDINKSSNYVFRTQPGAWRRVLMNLFGNALKYTPAGYIKIKLQVTPSRDPEDEHSELRLICTDSGIGMSENYVNNRLFHSFAQENPLSQGTGLGLSIVKQIVESLGGDVEVRSEKGYGTKFTVYCPLKSSMLSPAVRCVTPEKQLLSITKRTQGMNVQFVGFDEEDEYFTPVKSLKNKNATLLSMKALDNLCTDWFEMNVYKQGDPNQPAPDLFVATESGARRLRADNSNKLDRVPAAPVIVVCQGAASAQSTTAITVPGQIFECIAQPCGPHKFAQALTSCLDRHAARIVSCATKADSESTLPPVESLCLKENHVPVQDNSLKPARPTTPDIRNSFLDIQRPPMTTALSAPEVRSVNSSPVRGSKSTHRPLNCLAVDDNPINLRLLRTFVDKLHHSSLLATNGVEAVDAFKAASTGTRIDVVLMDINMPEMDGLEATRQIRAHERDAGLPPVTIIALTGVASTEAQQEAYISGVNLFLIKPVRLSELEVVLKGVVTSEEKKDDPRVSPQGQSHRRVLSTIE
ncbi:hypothetical protein BU24DRAFT_438222 [Aaosphaeria arxii CBS 175.79]|uniref:histidine kinase n=1 Tax=Aaosphaeria arxii CBS 175.79 TaxID=1450172 RepID=A0A6A5Y6J6_9PLEO|nr:uncharacterized protein BU24DRAFT_438222 [Aaosphaeria arxii CBS 175.79]KAF2020833.1 hypothetical protein BU24DRAFT_438222 [Aaosphaeria arxii CBS 175.79]